MGSGSQSHLPGFEIAKGDGELVWIGMPDLEGDDFREIRADFDERLDSWIHGEGERFFYNYDYGDGWRHELTVEAVEPAAARTRYPRCLGGERACPPEDVGGSGGYAELLEALSDPEHEEHEEYRRWVGSNFDPERFDPAKVRFEDPTRRLREVYGPA